MVDYEPGVMWLHRGELNAAQEIVRKLKTNYMGTEFGGMMDDIFVNIMKADRELAIMTEKKNKDIYDSVMNEGLHLAGGDNGNI